MSVHMHIASSGLLAAEYICLLANWFSLVLAALWAAHTVYSTASCSCGSKWVAHADCVCVC